MKNITNKKGQVHIEAILSILIFLGFRFALFYVIKPFDTPTQNNNVDIIKTNLPQYLMANLTQKGVDVLDDTGSNDCFYLAKQSMKGNTKVVADNLTDIESKSTTTDFYIRGKKGFYTIYTSDDFPDPTMDSALCVEAKNYRFSVTTKVEALSYNKILNFNKTYWENYGSTKTEINIPASGDYGFLIIDMKGNTIVNSFKSPTTSINLNAKEVSMPMIYSNGTIQNVRMKG